MGYLRVGGGFVWPFNRTFEVLKYLLDGFEALQGVAFNRTFEVLKFEHGHYSDDVGDTFNRTFEVLKWGLDYRCTDTLAPPLIAPLRY